MTYNVFMGTLNPTHSCTHSLFYRPLYMLCLRSSAGCLPRTEISFGPFSLAEYRITFSTWVPDAQGIRLFPKRHRYRHLDNLPSFRWLATVIHNSIGAPSPPVESSPCPRPVAIFSRSPHPSRSYLCTSRKCDDGTQNKLSMTSRPAGRRTFR